MLIVVHFVYCTCVGFFFNKMMLYTRGVKLIFNWGPHQQSGCSSCAELICKSALYHMAMHHAEQTLI